MKELCDKLGAYCIEPFVQDSTKIGMTALFEYFYSFLKK